MFYEEKLSINCTLMIRDYDLRTTFLVIRFAASRRVAVQALIASAASPSNMRVYRVNKCDIVLRTSTVRYSLERQTSVFSNVGYQVR